VKLPPSNRFVWFAVLGGPVAWAVQFVVNLYFTWAQCNAPVGRWDIPVHGWQIGLSAAAAAVTLVSMAAALWLYLYTFQFKHVPQAERRGEGTAPPTGRISFLATVGLTVNFLSLAIIVMTGIGAPLLPVCQQS
jgi:hypothetical protein